MSDLAKWIDQQRADVAAVPDKLEAGRSQDDMETVKATATAWELSQNTEPVTPEIVQRIIRILTDIRTKLVSRESRPTEEWENTLRGLIRGVKTIIYKGKSESREKPDTPNNAPKNIDDLNRIEKMALYIIREYFALQTTDDHGNRHGCGEETDQDELWATVVAGEK